MVLPCSEQFLSHLWRAVQASVSERSATFLGIVLALVYPAIIAFREGFRTFRENGLPGVRALVRERYLKALSVAGAIWIILIVWNFIFLPPRTLSVEEIALLSQGIVVDVGSANPDRDAIGSGFWIDSKGYLLVSTSEPMERLKVGVMIPPLIGGKLLAVAAGIMNTPGGSIYRDMDSTVEIVRVYNNPFIRRLHLFAEAEDTKTHNKERTTEKYWVPCLAHTDVSVGQPIFLAAVEPTKDGPALIIVQGAVARIGVDTNVKERSDRIYTTVPFKISYRGAPALDSTGQVVGVVMDGGESIAQSVLIPAKYISSAINAAKEWMYEFAPTAPFN